MTDAMYESLSRGCEREERNGVAWDVSPLLRPFVLHGFTERYGGVSQGPFSSLNLGWNRPEPVEIIKENYVRLCSAAGFDYNSMVLVAYEHGDGVCKVDKSDCGKGFGCGELPPCDAIITADPGVTLITLHADCMPVLLCDPAKKVCAAVHAGWKGASMRIGQKTAKLMQSELGCKGGDLLAWVGPSISQKRFEVDRDVRDAFAKDFGESIIAFDGLTGKYFIDLWRAMADQLLDAGLTPANIQLSGVCTFENVDSYYSYRRDKRVSGAMAAFIRLRDGTQDSGC